MRYIISSLLLSLSLGLLDATTLVQADTLNINTDAHGIQFVTGGIGSEEVEALQSYKKQFNLYFLFSEGKAGRVIDDVDLTILNSNKQVVFSVKRAAPRVLLSLPSGQYLAIANYQGSKQRLTFNHDITKHQRVIINWKNQIPEDSTDETDGEADTE